MERQDRELRSAKLKLVLGTTFNLSYVDEDMTVKTAMLALSSV